MADEISIACQFGNGSPQYENSWNLNLILKSGRDYVLMCEDGLRGLCLHYIIICVSAMKTGWDLRTFQC